MTRFAHLADCHLGSWKQPELQNLNFESFQKAVDICIKEKVDFIVFAGDLFDSAYPPIEILKEAFTEFKKLKDAGIPCFIVAGSHDSSVSGKTFLDVLERAGFCKNIENFELKNDKIILNPTIHGNIAFYGYPGKRAGLEVQDLKNISFQDSPGLFKLFVLHTTLNGVKGTMPIDSIDEETLPKADYYALGHIHIVKNYGNIVYPGPIFPNNFQELEELKHGGFYIVDISGKSFDLKRIDIKLKDIETIEVVVNDATTATDKIISEIEKRDIENKLILLRIKGVIEKGSNSDIKFSRIEEYVKKRNVYFLLRNTHDLKSKEIEITIESKNSENLEEETIKKYSLESNSSFNIMIPNLINVLSLEKHEDEKSNIFENRLIEELKKLLNF